MVVNIKTEGNLVPWIQVVYYNSRLLLITSIWSYKAAYRHVWQSTGISLAKSFFFSQQTLFWNSIIPGYSVT